MSGLDVEVAGGAALPEKGVGPEATAQEYTAQETTAQETTAPGPVAPETMAKPYMHDQSIPPDAWGQPKGMEAADWKERLLSRPLLVSIGEFDFENFKNRWGEDDLYHIVELLVGSDKSAHQESAEASMRANFVVDERQKWIDRHGYSLRPNRPKPETRLRVASGETWIQRIRIHSPIILHYLLEVTEAPLWSVDVPRVFFRPFKCLIYYHSHMKKVLRDLQENVANSSMSSLSPPADEGFNCKSASTEGASTLFRETPEAEGTHHHLTPTPNGQHSLTGQMAIDHLQCYVKFMDERIMPLENMFNDIDHRMVRFDDLWYLFKIGDVLYQPPVNGFPPDANGRQTTTKRYQTAFVLHRKDNYPAKDENEEDCKFNRRPMHLDCFYLDFDGESYGPVWHTIVINFFLGQRDIRDLTGYPIRFAPNSENIIDNLINQGKTFRSFVREKHVSCDGWTLTGPPMGSTWAPHEVKLPTHIESDVIIDFKEALDRQPLWRSEFEAPKPVDISEDWDAEDDEIRLLHWPDPGTPMTRPGPLFRLTEAIQIDDGVADQIQNTWVKSDPFLKAFGSQNTKTLDGINEDISNLLLPQRAFVYVLRTRYFAMVDVRSLKHIQDQPDIFDDLKIEEEHKVMVQSLVADHFEKRKVQRRNPMSGPISQDLVGGKGAGLCILLHGVPGVGKTATAEAVAQANKKPLFSMTCGDLGTNALLVDRSLTDLFRLAHLWDCVLLLDEADIFLAKRGNHDLDRNALVSVFLRILEYYSGILFLTTNRVGALDEAFKSRIHISLYYEPLNRLQTIEIFRLNIKKLSAIEGQKQELQNNTGQKASKLIIDEDRIMEYAIHHFENHHKTPHLRWNGRQIRNAFQIASSLAHYHIRKTSLSEEPSVASSERSAVVLDHKQFQRVAVAIERFGRYMDFTRAMTDREEARIEAIRADDVRNADLSPRPARRYYEDGPSSDSPDPFYNSRGGPPPPPRPWQSSTSSWQTPRYMDNSSSVRGMETRGFSMDNTQVYSGGQMRHSQQSMGGASEPFSGPLDAGNPEQLRGQHMEPLHGQSQIPSSMRNELFASQGSPMYQQHLRQPDFEGGQGSSQGRIASERTENWRLN